MKPSDIQDQRVSVIGAAKSGIAAATLLASAGADVLLSDHGNAPFADRRKLESLGIALETEGHSARVLETEFLVLSPGVPTSAAIVQEAARGGIAVYSEIEAASWFCEAQIVAITGTNGKTTTTSLLGHVFEQAGREVIVAGNIGYAFSDAVRKISTGGVVVLEVSSFQLDHIDTFRPTVSVLLNVTPDHLDRYGDDVDRYAASKYRIFENQRSNDVLVYNYDDVRVRERINTVTTHRDLRSLAFSYQEALTGGASLRDGTIVLRIHHHDEVLMHADDLALRGRHNLSNSLAAAVAARAMHVQCDTIRRSLASFEGVPHRLEFVRELSGVRYINDSKATNVNALWYALESVNTQVVLLVGGRDKGNDYSGMEDIVHAKVRATIAFGESAATVVRELGWHSGRAETVRTLEDATRLAQTIAEPGDVVLLSPACASFDQFDNYEHRGDTFKRLVQQL